MRILSLLSLLLLLTACGEWGHGVPEEVAAARKEATRRACIANQLSQSSDEELKTLQQTTGMAAPSVGQNVPQSAATAALAFARAYNQHAQLRTAAYAQVDSALNYSPTPGDSARHAANAAKFELSAPEPGSVEANVIQNYEQRFAAVYNDPRHPCNWLGQGKPEKFGS
jgi:hypothetical protein